MVGIFLTELFFIKEYSSVEMFCGKRFG